MQHRVPGRGIDSSSVLRLRPGGGGRGGISQWSLAVRRSSVLAGGQQDLHQESAGKIETHSQVEPGHSPEPIRGMEGRSWAGQHSSPSPTLDGVTPEVSHCQPQGDVTGAVISGKGRAWAGRGDVRSPRSSGGLWANTQAGLELLSPGSVYRSAGPGRALIAAKCTDSTINKHTADSTGANITPNIYQLSANP